MVQSMYREYLPDHVLCFAVVSSVSWVAWWYAACVAAAGSAASVTSANGTSPPGALGALTSAYGDVPAWEWWTSAVAFAYYILFRFVPILTDRTVTFGESSGCPFAGARIEKGGAAWLDGEPFQMPTAALSLHLAYWVYVWAMMLAPGVSGSAVQSEPMRRALHAGAAAATHDGHRVPQTPQSTSSRSTRRSTRPLPSSPFSRLATPGPSDGAPATNKQTVGRGAQLAQSLRMVFVTKEGRVLPRALFAAGLRLAPLACLRLVTLSFVRTLMRRDRRWARTAAHACPLRRPARSALGVYFAWKMMLGIVVIAAVPFFTPQPRRCGRATALQDPLRAMDTGPTRGRRATDRLCTLFVCPPQVGSVEHGLARRRQLQSRRLPGPEEVRPLRQAEGAGKSRAGAPKQSGAAACSGQEPAELRARCREAFAFR